jgi:hypothetical protein
MADGGETPGIGAPGIPKLHTRAPKAWTGLAHEVTVSVPRTMARTQRLRQRIRRIGGK